METKDTLLRFRAEFSDVKSLADVPRLSPERLQRFKQQLDQIDPPATSGAFVLGANMTTERRNRHDIE
jgi:hypothetical protein